ncbi:phosphoglycerate dehydrogenase [Thalassobacillus pellis]|uniref:phosphoglycerate dehydrogenase n=1 Tax=Thalassobacillus pellis TaxID=748008 RepID=UPI001960D4E8|nr:phosphoglycerate dehydrogenase [Thalassobacillus pellis]MBM7552183.1 D-3-phosphoglycerate dehydrogenase [Thalassobacillus pellis]
MSFRVLICDPLSEEGLAPLFEAEDIEVINTPGMNYEELLEKLADVDGLIVRSQTRISREIVEKADNLKVIGRAGVGVDNIDLDAATEHGVIVVNAPDGNTISAAEHSMAMLMALARNIPQAYSLLKNDKWERKSMVGVELKDKTLGVIGMGRIGREVALRAKGQRMKVIGYDPFLTEEKAQKLGIDFGTVEDVLKAADFITVHTPLIEETRHLIDREALEIMKPTARIINCARGGIIDEDALYEALKEGQIAGAALDVFENEPAIGHKLFELDQVIATPHLGASTIEAQENVAIDVSKDIVDILHDKNARNPVNIASFSPEVMEELSPYFSLTEKLGQFISRLTRGVLEKINIYYAGELVDNEVSPLTRNTVKGILRLHLGARINEVNAFMAASDRSIIIEEHKTTHSRGFTNLITVEIQTNEETRSVSGTLLNGLGPRIVKLDQYSVDVQPSGNLVVIRHHDKPGAIGKVGNLLAEDNVNIATMQVGRTDLGGHAVMVLSVDKQLDEPCMEKINQMEEIRQVHSLKL